MALLLLLEAIPRPGCAPRPFSLQLINQRTCNDTADSSAE